MFIIFTWASSSRLHSSGVCVRCTMSISSPSEGKVLGRCLLAWPCVLRGSRSPLEPLDHFCREWWQLGQISLSEAAGTSEARLTVFPGDVNTNSMKCGPRKRRGSGRAGEVSLDITPCEYSSETGKWCYRKTAGVHEGRPGSGAPRQPWQQLTLGAVWGTVQRRASHCRRNTFAVSVFRLSSCYGCFPRCWCFQCRFLSKGGAAALSVIPSFKDMTVLLATVSLVIYIFAGLKRPKTRVPVLQEDGKSYINRSDEGWQEEGKGSLPFSSLLWTFTVNIRMNGTGWLFYRRVSKQQPSEWHSPLSKDLSLKCAPTYIFEARCVYNLRVNGEESPSPV